MIEIRLTISHTKGLLTVWVDGQPKASIEASVPLQEEWLFQAIRCATRQAGLQGDALLRKVLPSRQPLPLHRPKSKPAVLPKLTLADLGLVGKFNN